MSSGLAALLDDVAAIARLAAASLDDVGAASAKASAKAAGVVIDDTAVTPTYVTGFSPERELPMIGRIALGSLRNKLLILLPGALLLSAFLPWAITPLLMLGGTFLCFEGAEKLIETLFHKGDGTEEEMTGDPAHLEAEKINGAIRTDLILSGEIMAISLADVAATPILNQAGALIVVSLLVTAGVYGVVALIVKMDDIGLKLAERESASSQRTGRMLVAGMPKLLAWLSVIGTAAMLWVGGHILLTSTHELGWHAAYDAVHHLEEQVHGGVVGWLVNTGVSAVIGLVVGAVVVALMHLRPGRRAH